MFTQFFFFMMWNCKKFSPFASLHSFYHSPMSIEDGVSVFLVLFFVIWNLYNFLHTLHSLRCFHHTKNIEDDVNVSCVLFLRYETTRIFSTCFTSLIYHFPKSIEDGVDVSLLLLFVVWNKMCFLHSFHSPHITRLRKLKRALVSPQFCFMIWNYNNFLYTLHSISCFCRS